MQNSANSVALDVQKFDFLKIGYVYTNEHCYKQMPATFSNF